MGKVLKDLKDLASEAGALAIRSDAAAGSVALLVDVANSLTLSLKQIKEVAEGLGVVEEAKAYGDFRQHHLEELATTLYGLGFELVHCPSWPNGGINPNGTRQWKRTDDVLMHKGAMQLAINRPSITTYVFGTADSDVIPTAHMLKEMGKRVILIHKPDGLGVIFNKCPFELIRMTPTNTTSRPATSPHRADGRNGRRVHTTTSDAPEPVLEANGVN